MGALLFSIHFSSLALGAASAFVIDLFFLTSARNRILTPKQVRIFSQLNFAAIICAVIALVTDVSVISFEVLTASNQAFGYWLLKLFLLSTVFLAGLTMRKIHLPALLRHQRHNSHLSDSFLYHSTPLINTVIISTVTWVSAVMGTSYEYFAATNQTPTPLSFLVLYCVAVFLSVKILTMLKNHITKIHIGSHSKSKVQK